MLFRSIKHVELPLGQAKQQNKTKQKGQVLNEHGQKKRKRKGQGQAEKGRARRNKRVPLAYFAAPRPQISCKSLQIMRKASLYMWPVSTRRIAHTMPP